MIQISTLDQKHLELALIYNGQKLFKHVKNTIYRFEFIDLSFWMWLELSEIEMEKRGIRFKCLQCRQL